MDNTILKVNHLTKNTVISIIGLVVTMVLSYVKFRRGELK